MEHLPIDASTLLAAALIFIFSIAAWLFWRSRTLCTVSRADLPPGSLGLPFIGETLQLVAASRQNLFEFSEARHRRYGEVFKTHIFGKPCIFVAGAKAAKMLYLSGNRIFDSAHLGNIEALFGEKSIVSVRGEEHKRIRRITNEVFGIESIKRFVERVEEVALHTLSTWQKGQVRNLEDDALEFTLNFIARTLLSWTPSLETKRMQTLSAALASGVFSLPIRIPGFQFHRAWKSRNALIHIFKEEIQRRKGMVASGMPDDLMTKMITPKDPATGDNLLGDDEIAHNMVTFILAGHETSVSIIMFIIKYLDENPSVEEALRVEHEQIRQRKPDLNAPLTWSEVKQMSFTEKVINEAMRLANIAPWMPRISMQDYRLEDCTIPKGWLVVLNARRTHLMSDNFPDPLSFNPSRFEQPPKPFSLVPFGLGDRLCVGKDLAKLEICIFLHHMCIGFKWKRDTKDMGLDFSGIPKPKGGVPIEIIEKLR